MNPVVYIIHSQKLDMFYIGQTIDLTQRLHDHNNGIFSKSFTHKGNDWKIIHVIECSCKRQAIQIELHIKAMKSRIYIKNLTKYPEISIKLLKQYK